MNDRLKKIFFVFLLFLITSPSYAIVAGGIVTVQHKWPAGREFDKLSFFEQISYDGGPKSHYYWASQFSFKNGNGGYIGLQNSKGVHFVNYSIWNAVGWKSKHCKRFSGEGSGVQCQIKMPWKVGHQYRLDVSKEENLVTGTIIDLMDRTKTTLGVIEVPKTFGKFDGSLHFVEEYSQGNEQLASCFVMGAQSSIFRAPIGDDTVKAKHMTYSYGNCNDPYVVQTACNDDACVNTVSNLGGKPISHVSEVAFVNGEDLSAETISNVLKKADLAIIRLEDGSWVPNIYFPQPDLFKEKSILIDHKASYGSVIYVNNSKHQSHTGEEIIYTSDGRHWKIVK
ncbi:DUF3472 domain-containing protein [Bartonella raoultii]|uniref:DUF3472 domain-containing protein n=1 Tax=Bartonella raoultii TaxID=1457020 RepID=A0ABS7I3L7_9HYPH|nr:DUF3472 domain-containing protein [Bartonella raoultii]MBX4335175.1 DUF3472 domain-containing protein [Bartonella raoultii]